MSRTVFSKNDFCHYWHAQNLHFLLFVFSNILIFQILGTRGGGKAAKAPEGGGRSSKLHVSVESSISQKMLFQPAFLCAHLGIWLWGDYRSRCGFLSLSFLYGCFLISVLSLVIWSMWPVVEQGFPSWTGASFLVADLVCQCLELEHGNKEGQVDEE